MIAPMSMVGELSGPTKQHSYVILLLQVMTRRLCWMLILFISAKLLVSPHQSSSTDVGARNSVEGHSLLLNVHTMHIYFLLD